MDQDLQSRQDHKTDALSSVAIYSLPLYNPINFKAAHRVAQQLVVAIHTGDGTWGLTKTLLRKEIW